MVGQVAAGERIERTEQVVEAVEESDGERGAADRHEVERQELLGHVLAHADEDDHAEHADDTAAEAEELADFADTAHGAGLYAPGRGGAIGRSGRVRE